MTVVRTHKDISQLIFEKGGYLIFYKVPAKHAKICYFNLNFNYLKTKNFIVKNIGSQSLLLDPFYSFLKCTESNKIFVSKRAGYARGYTELFQLNEPNKFYTDFMQIGLHMA